jgi:hypothetical protein
MRHYLAALAYRTQKAVRDAPKEFGSFDAGNQVRTPNELVRHMTSVLGYARTFFIGGSYRPDALESFHAEIDRFHRMLELLSEHLTKGDAFLDGMTEEKMLHGPFSDAMTHVGQLGILRRLFGDPVPPENFIHADVTPANLSADQSLPASPDAEWREAPKDSK